MTSGADLPSPAVRTLRDRLGLPRGRGALPYGLAGLVNYTGTGLFYPFALLYFHHQLDVPMVEVGTLYTVAIGAGVLGVTWTGRLVDRFGAKQVLVFDALLKAAIFACYPLLHNLTALMLLAAVVALADRTDQVAGQAVVSGLTTAENRPGWFALSRMTLNAGMGGGALIGGLLLSTSAGYPWLARGDAISFALAAAMYLLLRPTRTAVPPKASAEGAWRDGLFLRIAVLSGLLYLVGLSVEIGLPVYLIQYLKEPTWTVSVVFAVNTGLVTLLQLPVTERIRHRPAMRMLAYGTIGYALTFFLFFLADQQVHSSLFVASLVVAVAVFTMGELVTSVTSMVVVNNLAPAARKGSYLAVGQLFVGLASTVAPILFTAGLSLSPTFLWMALSVLALGVAAAVLLSQRKVDERLREPAAEAAPEATAPVSSTAVTPTA